MVVSVDAGVEIGVEKELEVAGVDVEVDGVEELMVGAL